VGIFLVRHQKDRFDLRVQLAIGHHHGELASDIGQGPHAAHHDPSSELADEINRQAVER
jgi:hypothetical protein